MPRIVTLPGDGIGPEVLAPAVRILTQLVPGVEVDEHVFGGHSIDVHGTALTDDTLAACRGADAVLLGSGEALYLSSEVAGGFTGAYLGVFAEGEGEAEVAEFEMAEAPAD